VAWLDAGSPGGTPKPFQVTLLPGDLGRQFLFGFVVELPYSEVPKPSARS